MNGENKNEYGAPDLSRIIGMLGSNPQLLSTMLSSLSGPKPTDIEPSGENAASLPAPAMGITKGKSGKRELLCALKPFLSAHRCENIDRILHMYDLFDLLKNYR